MLNINTKNNCLILQIFTAMLTLFTTIAIILYFVPNKQTVTKIKHVTVPQADPIKITSLDIDLTYNGSQDDFEDLLDNHDDPNNDDFSIDNVSFNEDSQEIDVPNSYLNIDDNDQALNSLLTQPHYVGQTYYSNNQHPAVNVTIKRSNIFGKQIKNKTNEYNIWPKDLKVGQPININTFTTKNHHRLNNYENTSYFTNSSTDQNTIIHVEGNYKTGKYSHSWTGDYQITVNPQTHKLTWTSNDIDNN